MKNPTNLLILLVLIIGTFRILETILKEGSIKNWPVYKRELMSKPEQVLFHRIKNAYPDKLIMSQVQLSRMIGIKKGKNYNKFINRINRMSVDFVICNKDSTIMAAIELDDNSHNKSERRNADNKKDNVLKAASIPVYRFNVKDMPTVEAIKNTIDEKGET